MATALIRTSSLDLFFSVCLFLSLIVQHSIAITCSAFSFLYFNIYFFFNFISTLVYNLNLRIHSFCIFSFVLLLLHRCGSFSSGSDRQINDMVVQSVDVPSGDHVSVSFHTTESILHSSDHSLKSRSSGGLSSTSCPVSDDAEDLPLVVATLSASEEFEHSVEPWTSYWNNRRRCMLIVSLLIIASFRFL